MRTGSIETAFIGCNKLVAWRKAILEPLRAALGLAKVFSAPQFL